jgi:hypothetical protein
LDISTGLLITTAIMALGTTTFAALGMAFQRSHNRKSIKPFCNIHKCVTDTEASVSIQNAGLGPMLIQKIALLKNQDDSIQTGIPLADALSSELNCDVFIHNTDVYVLASLCELKLFQCSAGTSDKGAMPLLKDKLNGYFLCIKYADLYDRCYEKIEALTF